MKAFISNILFTENLGNKILKFLFSLTQNKMYEHLLKHENCSYRILVKEFQW